MMQTLLTIDIGNSRTKYRLLPENGTDVTLTPGGDSPEAVALAASGHHVTGVAICSVARDPAPLARGLRRLLKVPVMVLDNTTLLPLDFSEYDRASLGADRIAAAVGAHAIDGGDWLVVDAGTALTTDLVAGGRFLGGNISPGLRLRFESLHNYTSKLPLVKSAARAPQLGHDTESAIRAGVAGGLCAEIAMLYSSLREEHPGLRIVVTGGDAKTVCNGLKRLGYSTSICPSLVEGGLLFIYDINMKMACQN